MRTLSKETQASITPDLAIDILKKGNERFVNNLRVNRNLLEQVNETSSGQYPFAVILSCIDSRTSAELIFDQGLGDIFSIRIAGNIINEDILGSMEFGCKVAGAKAIVVLGHTKCGAVKGAYEDVKLGNLSVLLSKIKPAVSEIKSSEKEPLNDGYGIVDEIAEINVRRTVYQIPQLSPILKELQNDNSIKIIGGIHDICTGHVKFYD
jgi:carbonic anhydrase